MRRRSTKRQTPRKRGREEKRREESGGRQGSRARNASCNVGTQTLESTTPMHTRAEREPKRLIIVQRPALGAPVRADVRTTRASWASRGLTASPIGPKQPREGRPWNARECRGRTRKPSQLSLRTRGGPKDNSGGSSTFAPQDLSSWRGAQRLRAHCPHDRLAGHTALVWMTDRGRIGDSQGARNHMARTS